MANYGYVAMDGNGKEKKGSVEADSKDKALSIIKAEGLVPITVTEQGALSKDINLSIGSKKVKSRDLSVFCRQFVSIITAGVTIIDALGMLSEQTENKSFAAIIKEVQIGIEKGNTLSSAMADHPNAFPPMLVNMVNAGEASGNLEVAFERMAIQFEKDARLQGMIKKAMIYPIVLLIVAIGVVIVMLTTVIPSFKGMFDDLGSELPGITLWVMAASDFLMTYWYLVIVGVVLIAGGIIAFKKSDMGQRFFGTLARKLPLFGVLTVKSSSSRLARTLSTLLAAGISMMDALEITAKNMSNIYFKEALMVAKEDVAKGVPLSVSLERAELFPPMVNQMVHIGEETGDLESMLEKMADYYDEEVEIATQSLMAALEPLVIVVMALIVGVLIGAVMAPMAQLYQDLDSL